MKRILKWFALVLILLLLVIAVLWWWLTDTRSGASWALDQAQSRVEQLSWGSLEGSFSDGLIVQNLSFEQGGVEVDIQRLELALGVRLGSPVRVNVRRLYLDGLEIQLPPADPEAPAAPFELGNYASPVDITITDLAVRQAKIYRDEATLLEIQLLEFAGRYAEVLQIERLQLQADPYQLQASGEQGLTEPWASDLDLELNWQLDQQTLQELNLSTGGPVDALSVDGRARGPLSGQFEIALKGLPDMGSLNAELDFSGGLAQWPGLDAEVNQITVDAQGGLEDWQAGVSATIAWADWPQAQIGVQATGSTQQITIQRGLIELLNGQIALSGQAGLSDPMTASAQIELSDLDFTALYPEWPDQAAVSGSMSLDVQGDRLALDNLELRAPPSPLSLSGQAELNLQTEALSVLLDWQSLTWPPVPDTTLTEPLFSSESGRLEASGTLQEWQAEIEAMLAFPGTINQPQGRIELQANGDANEIAQFSGRLRSDEVGMLTLSGRAGFDGSVQADLGLSDFDPSPLWANWPGQINGQLSLSVDPSQPLSAALQIKQLSGQLRNLPLSGQGGLSIQQQQIGQADLAVSLGDNQLELTSEEGELWRVDLDARSLNQLWPELSGDLRLIGSAAVQEGRAQWQLSSDQITFRQYAARALQINGQAGWLQDPSLQLELQALDVDLNPWERIDQLTLEFNGDCQNHVLETSLNGSRADFAIKLQGSLPECLDNLAVWSGQLEQFALTNTVWGDWALSEPAAISVGDSQIAVEQTCLRSQDGPSQLCLRNFEAASQAGQASVSLRELPIELLLLPLNPPFRISSELDGDMKVAWSAAGLQTIEGDMTLGQGAVRAIYSEDDLLAIDRIDLNIQSPQAGSALAQIQAYLEGDTELDAELMIPDLNALETLELNSTVFLDLPELAVFNRLFPQLDEIGGRLDGQLVISGPIVDPQINGRLSLTGGRLLYAPLGSRVSDLNLELVADQSTARLEGSFNAGEGQASLTGTFSDEGLEAIGWQGELDLTGNDLQLFDVDWLSLTLSPDLNIGFDRELLSLNGTLAIDRARLGLPPGAEQQIETSPDVVIVNGQPQKTEDEVPDALRDISGSVQLTLGDDVKLDAAGMETNLTGKLNVQWTPGDPMPTGEGAIVLADGSYSAYGQNLEVEQGRVEFTGQPIDNPRLDIQAVRQIFGDTQVEQAGVSIQGRAQNPEIVLFTSPPTSREKALAYLLTGADFDHAGGQGAFNVGFWVLPNVFVSYGLGLFDSGNVLAARWELSRRWGLRATSGESDTGADISFMIER